MICRHNWVENCGKGGTPLFHGSIIPGFKSHKFLCSKCKKVEYHTEETYNYINREKVLTRLQNGLSMQKRSYQEYEARFGVQRGLFHFASVV